VTLAPLAFLDIGLGEMVVVAFVALLLFGGRLPDMMRKFGASYREFRRGLEDVARDPTSRRSPPHASVPYQPKPPDALPDPGRPAPTGAPAGFPPMPLPKPDAAPSGSTPSLRPEPPPAHEPGTTAGGPRPPPVDDAPLV
jgi:TatA/E family protein of Tat protein translocase